MMSNATAPSPYEALHSAIAGESSSFPDDASPDTKAADAAAAASNSDPAYTLRRVETNQRALIDKILARYATRNAVYRELLQNSNDAGAGVAEIRFGTTAAHNGGGGGMVSAAASAASVRPGGKASSVSKRPLIKRVVYRNNGRPFRPVDWARLSKIAEGNPDPSKIGAFGVGAYTMFSVCEEPMVISGDQVLVFVWRDDALWTRVGPVPDDLVDGLGAAADAAPAPKAADEPSNGWTTFVLPSRDLYPLPSLTALGKFLASALTFTKSLRTIRVYVDDVLELSLSKELIQPPKEIKVAQKSAWSSSMGWAGLKNKDGMAISGSSSGGIFTLGVGGRSIVGGTKAKASSSSGVSNGDGRSITESVTRLTVTLSDQTSSVDARYLSAPVSVKAPRDMVKRMERVTKKGVPDEIRVEVFLAAGASQTSETSSGDGKKGSGKRSGSGNRSGCCDAKSITASFAPSQGSGRIYIGFQTSQTTGLAAHVSAPFVPTVEREAIDLVEPTLRAFNTELLEVAGMVLRLGLERAMEVVGERFDQKRERYLEEDERLAWEARTKKKEEGVPAPKQDIPSIEPDDEFDDIPLDDDGDETTVSKSLVSFAKFMARGVKSTIVNVVRTVDDLVVNDEEAELLRPYDPRPLSAEEHDAILLMRSFCPRPSTPDPDVGTAIANGFTRAMSKLAPPVLTRTGLMQGNDARLPNGGIEAFVNRNVVRKVVLDNASEYHEVIAECRLLKVEDLIEALDEDGRVLEEREVVRLLKWWVKYSRLEPSTYGSAVKRNVVFHSGGTTTAGSSKEKEGNADSVVEANDLIRLNDIYYFVDDPKIFSDEELPMPGSVLSKSIRDAVGSRVLGDVSLRNWFTPLPIDIWATYVCDHHASMTDGLSDDARIRRLVLLTLSREYDRRQGMTERSNFAVLLKNLLSEKRCIPYELSRDRSSSACVTEYPTELYLPSAELEAFDGLRSFRKVCPMLTEAGVSEEFLLALGVRRSVSVEFLFSHLDTLKWSSNPKPLIAYLRSANLTRQDLEKLRTTQYLPSVGESSRTFAPAELYLTNSELSKLKLPFVRFLQWPSDDNLSAGSADGSFLVKIGCHVDPPLQVLLHYLAKDVKDDGQRVEGLNFVSKRLAPGGPYESVYVKPSALTKIRFLPCIRKDPLDSDDLVRKELHAPKDCYLASGCQCMGFPVLDPDLDKKSGRLYGSRFQCALKPPTKTLVNRLLEVVSAAQSLMNAADRKDLTNYCNRVSDAFDRMFRYLSTRSNEFDAKWKTALIQMPFIPCKVGEQDIEWHSPNEVRFKNPESDDAGLVASLFPVIGFSPFLAAVGVRSDVSVQDIFRLLLIKPAQILQMVGVTKYLGLLHRISADPPFKSVTNNMRQTPFLIAFQQDEGNESERRPVLAKAGDIYIIDNSFFGRMFPALCAPHESDLEDLYAKLGAQYLSESVDKQFKVMGAQHKNTPLTAEFSKRLRERKPLLISPKNTSRPLVKNAAQKLDDNVLEIVEVDGVKAVYTLGAVVKSQRVTCCSERSGWQKIALFITQDLDMFDVGLAIGSLILQRCQVEDAFLLSNLLEAPLETLRSRGFAIDRVVKVKERDTTADVNTPSKQDDKMTSIKKDRVSQHAMSTPDGHSSGLTESTKEPSKQPPLAKRPKHKLFRKSGSSKLRGPRFLNQNKGGLQSGLHSTDSNLGVKHQPPSQAASDDGRPISPQADASSHKIANDVLINALRSSQKVNSRGIHLPDRLLATIPKDLERGINGCEVIPGQQLSAFGSTSNGIRVFFSLKSASSENFLHNNHQAVVAFAAVLSNLCEVYSLRVDNIAIYHEPSGNTIAFNSNNALYFNLRLFCHLHFNPHGPETSECYSYWFTTMAHELAHNLVSEHNKDHGYYTECYIAMFLPKLSALLYEIGIV